ncbi:GLPGLI family protein [Lutibacter sp. HS1-25]|uniref:GLPGLI family protein n=1 Tax=Lutibacter sp. HS1-25 TaxID=2485000 RepID=UPI0010134803|nr:GLPGLI family protein [Lutibacter sp. HS1-25]RXP60342.1 GLPGLI family protein [Lutibacter sp. HS1-25]
MKKFLFKISTIVLLLFSFLLKAQDFQGKATYFSKTTMDIDFSKTGIPADRIQMIKERMKNNLEKTYEFTFDKTASIYKQEEKIDQSPNGGGGGGMRMMMFGGGASGKYYKNIQTKVTAQENEFSGKFFLVKDSLTTYNWKMEQETKMIGNYLCFKATTIVERPVKREFQFGRGSQSDSDRKEADKKEEAQKNMKELITVTAWYTLDIPVSNGPGEYWGLPGLILEISDDNMQILCTKIVINPKDKVEITEPSKGKVVSQKAYDEMVVEKTKEMRERMQNERQKSDGGGAGRMRP